MIWEIHHLFVFVALFATSVWAMWYFGPRADDYRVGPEPEPTQLPVPVRKQLPAPTEQQPIFYPREEKPTNPKQLWERETLKIVLGAWLQATWEQADSKLYDVHVEKPKWYSSYVVFPMKLATLLPTPAVEQMVNGPYKTALRAAFAGQSQDTDKAERVNVTLRLNRIEVTVPAPVKRVDLHIRNMLKHQRPAVQLSARNSEQDIYGLLGVDAQDKLVHINFADNPVALFVGKTRSGKTANLLAMLLSLLLTNDEKRIELYIAAVRLDQWLAFRHLPHTKFIENTGSGIVAMLQELMKKTQEAAGRDADGQHPTRILVVDDLSGLAKLSDWKLIQPALVFLTMSGGGANTYTCITSHRITEEGGMGAGGKAIAMNAGARIATFTAGSITDFADHLGVRPKQAEAVPMPKAKAEAAVSFDGETPRIIRTTYVKWQEIEQLITKGVDEPWEEVEESPHEPTPPHSTRVEPYTNGHTSSNSHTPNTPDYNGYINAATRAEVRGRDDDVCQWCFGEGTDDKGPDGHSWEFDHVWPKSKGGSDLADNVVLSCRTCNRAKSDMLPGDFIKRRLLELDGNVPVIRVVNGQYAPSAWDALRIFYAKEKRKRSISAIAKIALGSKGGTQNKRVQQFIEWGAKVYEGLREAHYV